MSINEIIQSKNFTVIDVRTPQEFHAGNVKGSKNIPLLEIEDNMEEIRSVQGEILLCCASGGRSQSATNFLKSQGFNNVHNAGSWINLLNI